MVVMVDMITSTFCITDQIWKKLGRHCFFFPQKKLSIVAHSEHHYKKSENLDPGKSNSVIYKH